MSQTALAVVPSQQFNQVLKTSTPLTGAQKAAVILQALLSQGGVVSLTSLNRAAQSNLAATFSTIEHVDQDVVDNVISEFEAALGRDGLPFAAKPSARLSALSQILTEDLIDSASTQMGLAQDDTLWRDVGAMQTDLILPILTSENPRIGAIILSKLPPARAAEIMGDLDPAVAAAMAQMIATTEKVGTEVAKQIAMTLISSQNVVTDNAFSLDAIGRMSAILDAAKPSLRDKMLEDLAADDPEFAKKVRAAIFTFEDIPARVAVEDIAKVTREVSNDDLILALGHGSVNAQDTVKHILGNMSGRMATQLQEEITEAGAVKPEVGEAAQGRIAARIRELSENGDLTLNQHMTAEIQEEAA